MKNAGLHYFDADWIIPTTESLRVDLCIYGATSAGIMAAVEATRRGRTVALLNPGRHIGGLTSGGLGWTDYGKQHVIGGLARDFYRRVGALYGKPEEWQFEPHKAARVFETYLREAGVTVRPGQYLDRVELMDGRIARITLLGGLSVVAKVFMDATYEGDLLAAAGVSFHVGREANAQYGETLNGVQVHGKHQFAPATVSAFVKPGDPSSGLLPFVEGVDLRERTGAGDHRVQAYNFRICMTDDPALRIPWEQPADFHADWYAMALRWFNAEKDRYNEHLWKPGLPGKFDVFPNLTAGGHRKTDTNNQGAVSSDFIGANWDWPNATYVHREAIFQRHVSWQKGFYWLMANDPRIPERYRSAYALWGLARDEFTDCGGWSPQLYVREARRMVADIVLTEHDCMHRRRCEDPVAMGSYNLDSHNCTRFATREGLLMNEGDVQVAPAGPYGISYRCIVPRRGEAANLLAPVCCSTSHIAYGSVRMEPVFMALGQSGAVAACLAMDDALVTLQDLPYARLRRELDALGQVVAL